MMTLSIIIFSSFSEYQYSMHTKDPYVNGEKTFQRRKLDFLNRESHVDELGESLPSLNIAQWKSRQTQNA